MSLDAHHLSEVCPMIAFMKSLWRDRRGNALVIAAAALPLVIGSAGLASDTIEWALWKRQLQRAADSAALAGVYAKVESQSYTAAITTDLARNNRRNAEQSAADWLLLGR
jgi:Flp pilus assembly protein TadG